MSANYTNNEGKQPRKGKKHHAKSPASPSAQQKNNSSERVSPIGWLSTAQVLKIMDVSSRTLQKWRTENLVTYSYFLGKVYHRESDFIEVLEKNKVEKRRDV